MSSNTKPKWVRTAAIALAIMTATTYLWRQQDRGNASGSPTATSRTTERALAGPVVSKTVVEDSKARQEDFGRALAEMNNRVAALRSQIASLEQEQGSRALYESPAAPISDQEAAAPALSRQEELQRADAQVQAQEDLIEETVVSERSDPDWAPAAETAIGEAFQAKEIQSLKLVDAQCRTTLCRIEIAENGSVVDGGSFDEGFRKLLIHTPWQGQGFGRVYDPFGPSPTGVLFLAREGNALPQPTP